MSQDGKHISFAKDSFECTNSKASSFGEPSQNFFNSDNSQESYLSSEDTQEIELDPQNIAIGDISNTQGIDTKKKKQKIKMKTIISLALDKKQSKQYYEEDKLFEASLKQLNPTQYRINQSNSKKNLVHKKYPFVSQQSLNQLLGEEIRSNHFSTNSIKSLKIHLKQGLIQPRHYKQFFLVASGAHLAIQQNKGYYQALTLQYQYYPQNYFEKIIQDSVRTGVTNLSQDETQLKIYQDKLKNVLSAYSVRNPYVRYCQGMNYIAMFLLRHITEGCEEEAFWILTQLLECVLSLEMYSNPSFFTSYLAIFEEFLKQISSEILDKMKATQTQFLVFPFNEIFSLFCNSLQPQISATILMNLILFGQRILYSSTISLLLIAKPQILKSSNYGEMNDALLNLKKFDDVEEFIVQLNDIYINKRAFSYLIENFSRQQHHQDNSGKNNKNQKIENQVKKKKLDQQIQCNKQFPVCEYVNLMIKEMNRGFSYFVFKQKYPIVISDKNHFNLNKVMLSSKEDNQIEISRDNIDDLIIGRFNHICFQSRKDRSNRQSLFVTPYKQPIITREKSKTQTQRYFNSLESADKANDCTVENEKQTDSNFHDNLSTGIIMNTSSILDKEEEDDDDDGGGHGDYGDGDDEQQTKVIKHIFNQTSTANQNKKVSFSSDQDSTYSNSQKYHKSKTDYNEDGENLPQVPLKSNVSDFTQDIRQSFVKLNDSDMQKLYDEQYQQMQSQSQNRQRTRQVIIPSNKEENIIEINDSVSVILSLSRNSANNSPNPNNFQQQQLSPFLEESINQNIFLNLRKVNGNSTPSIDSISSNQHSQTSLLNQFSTPLNKQSDSFKFQLDYSQTSYKKGSSLKNSSYLPPSHFALQQQYSTPQHSFTQKPYTPSAKQYLLSPKEANQIYFSQCCYSLNQEDLISIHLAKQSKDDQDENLFMERHISKESEKELINSSPLIFPSSQQFTLDLSGGKDNISLNPEIFIESNHK